MVVTVADERETLTRYLPDGAAWGAKWLPGTLLYELMDGLAPTMKRATDVIDEFIAQINPAVTTQYMNEWENAIGLPNDCFDIASDATTRLRNIKIWLSARFVQTQPDFEALALLFPFTITCRSGIEHDDYATTPPTMTGQLGTTAEQRDTIVIASPPLTGDDFAYTFPIVFPTTGDYYQMQCVMRKIKPAHCKMVFVQN